MDSLSVSFDFPENKD